ncbi:XPA protein C-terminus [Fragilaria crotonensis]|nr:XPA protein C-terminus [Fragilaria crotonensis]
MLTEEQKELIRQNRERALQLQKKKRECVVVGEDEAKERCEKKIRIETKVDEEIDLEEFEIAASKFVTQREAKQVYCLPEGTLAVCSYVEKTNPRGKGFKPMKLYDRAEIRRRARERFGGLDGLIAERNRRAEERFRRDLERNKDLFK